MVHGIRSGSERQRCFWQIRSINQEVHRGVAWIKFCFLGRNIFMNTVRFASLALAAFAVSFGSVAMADCGGCGGRQGLLAKLHAKKEAGCNGGGLIAKIKEKMASKCSGAPSCCAPAPSCCPAPAPVCAVPAPSCGCAAPAPSCGCAAPAPSCGCAAPAPSCGCAAPAPAPSCGCGASMSMPMESYVSAPSVSSGCSSCGTTMDAGVISTSTIVPPAPAPAPAAPAAPASVSDKAPAA